MKTFYFFCVGNFLFFISKLIFFYFQFQFLKKKNEKKKNMDDQL